MRDSILCTYFSVNKVNSIFKLNSFKLEVFIIRKKSNEGVILSLP